MKNYDDNVPGYNSRAFVPLTPRKPMGRRIFLLLGAMAACCAPGSILLAAHNSADYALRVHIYQFLGAAHFYGATGTLDYHAGQGQANLYENGEPRGVEFRFHCPDYLRVSVGWETYLARWKKPEESLEVLVPKIGKPNATTVCELKVTVRQDIAFVPRGDGIAAVPAAAMKKWMHDYQYDPEHDKNTPIPPSRP